MHDDLYLRKIWTPKYEVDRICFFNLSAGFVSDLIICWQHYRIIPLSHPTQRVARSTAFTLQVGRKGKLIDGLYYL